MAWSGADEEPLGTSVVCEEEDEQSSNPDSVFSEDEDYFFEGIDPYQDIPTAEAESQQLSGPPQDPQRLLPPEEESSEEDEENLPKRDRFQAISRTFHMSDPEEDAVNNEKKGTEDYDGLHRLRPLYDSLRAAYLSGYTFDFNVYTGKQRSASGMGLSFDAVAALVNKDCLGSGYHIYCNRFYTSPALFRHLWDLGFGACGVYSVGETVMKGRKTSNGYEKVPVPRPTCVGEYTRFMEAVDLSDQLSGSYSTVRMNKKWYKTVFHHFLDIAATNSYILHRQLCASSRRQPLSHQAFHELLSAQLCGVSLIPSELQPDREKRHRTPVAIATGFPRSMRASLGRRKCQICGRSTPFQCCVCKVSLCVILDRNCHDDFHNEIESMDSC
ncbi:uncharacterized protein V6R79_007048 [Siganus canaliculatus]